MPQPIPLGANITLGLPTVNTTAAEEMDAFDQLGPRTRDALHRASTKFSAAEILVIMTGAGWDPTFPKVDRAMAEIISGTSRLLERAAVAARGNADSLRSVLTV